MKSKIFLPLAFIIIFQLSGVCLPGVNDTVPQGVKKEKPPVLEPYHWNVIKFNPTPMLLWGNIRNITFTYERLVAKNHSLSFQAGYLLFPKIVNDSVPRKTTPLVNIRSGNKYGINLALDYRYYPFSRNRRPAPDGLYIGAYLSYYGFRFSNDLDVLYTTVDQNGSIKGKLNIVNLGMSIGYQFIFWKRFTLDLLMFGPSLSHYSGALEINGSLDPEEIQKIDEEVVDKFLEKFPFFGTLFSNENLKFTGSRASLSVGFRYSIQLGFHF